MARGRFISNEITKDRQVHELSCDTCRLAYTWLITLADSEGRVTGEPDLLLSALFPRRRDITPDTIQQYIDEWVEAGFVLLYLGSDGDRVIQLINFDKHQIGLRKDRETASVYEAPDECQVVAGVTPDDCRSDDGKNRVNVNVKSNVKSNVKLSAGTREKPNAFTVYEAEIGLITAHIAETLKADIEEYTDAWVSEAIKIASGANARNVAYIEAILQRWKVEGKNNNGKRSGNKLKSGETVEEHNQRIIMEVIDAERQNAERY